MSSTVRGKEMMIPRITALLTSCVFLGACSSKTETSAPVSEPSQRNDLVSKAKDFARTHEKSAELIKAYPTILDRHEVVERTEERVRIRFSVGEQPKLSMGPGIHRTGGMIDVWLKADGTLARIVPHEYRMSIVDNRERLGR